MRDDRTTLEMLKEVAFKAPWPLVERVTHLALAVAVGYAIAKLERSEVQQLEDIARFEVEKRIQDKAFHERLRKMQEAKQGNAEARRG